MYHRNIAAQCFDKDYHGRAYSIAFYERNRDTGVFEHHYISRVSWQGVIVAISANEFSNDFTLEYITEHNI